VHVYAKLRRKKTTMATLRQTAILNIIASFVTLIAAGIILTIFLTI